jgi:general stress protein CsbA
VKQNVIRRATPFLLVGLFIFSVALMMLPSYRLLVKPRGQSFDLFWVWVGGRFVLTGNNPYGPEATRAIQLGVFKKVIPPEEYQHGFPHPAYIAFVLLPFVILPFSWSVLLWISLQIPLFMIILLLGFDLLDWPIRPPLLFLLGFLTTFGFRYPINVYVLGQLTFFVIFCLLLSAWLFQRQNPRWAAVAMACATIRPDLSLPAIVLALILTWNSPRRNQFVTTLLGAGLVLAVLPVPFIGFWPLTWINAIRSYGSNPFATWPPELLRSLWLMAVLLTGMTVWTGRHLFLSWQKPTLLHQRLMVSAMVLFSLIVLPQTGSYILTLVLIPALILLRYARPLWLRAIIASSLLMPWLYLMLGKHFETLIFLLIPLQFVLFQEIVRRFPRLSS